MDAARICPRPARVQNRHRAANEIGAAYDTLAIPVDLFHVIILGDGQFITAFQAAALEHLAPIWGGHALAKAVDAQAAAYSGLVSSLRHGLFLNFLPI